MQEETPSKKCEQGSHLSNSATEHGPLSQSSQQPRYSSEHTFPTLAQHHFSCLLQICYAINLGKEIIEVQKVSCILVLVSNSQKT